MQLTAGTKVGPYEIVAPLGAGGMGVVYRAKDTRLDREVAIKVLPAEFAQDVDQLKRFEQEARATSALNHPNILTVYDIGTYEGAPYIVAELLDGEELRVQLDACALPVRKATEYAQQIAAGLAAAHEKGIVHRDLKPENLFVTKDGRVKILDFGLAKLRPQKFGGGVDSEAPTMKPLTNPGVVMGTVGYMSPEQVRGQETDHRSDIFSFGIILHEMLSGQRTFTGDSLVELMNAILKDEPAELSETNAKVSPQLEKLVRRCLEKKPERRFQSTSDLGFALEALSVPSSSGSNRTEAVQTLETAATTKRSGWRERIGWIAAGVLALMAISLGVAYVRRPPPGLQPIRFTLNAPEKTNIDGLSLVISPDGRRLAFCATDATGKKLLYLRPLNSFTTQALPGTEGATRPFWSPDSRSLGFFSSGRLKRIELSGGLPQTICEASYPGGASWNQAGEIIMAPTIGGAIYRVPATGGTPAVLTTLDQPRGDASHWLPQFLPDGQHFIYFIASRQVEQSGIYVGSLQDKATRLALKTEYQGFYAAGHLLFVRDGALMGQPFDPRALQPGGEPFLIADSVRLSFTIAPHLGVSEGGVLAYQSGASQTPQLIWFDRAGRQSGTIGEPGDYSNPSLSPDGRRLAVGIRDPQTKKRDIWLFDLARGNKSRFTFDPAEDVNPRWSFDGSRILFTSERKGQRDLFQKSVNAVEEEELLYASPEPKNVEDVSPDGRLMIYNVQPRGLWLLPLAGARKPQPFFNTQFREDMATISLDGRWVAYKSNESGKFEVYVTTFPQPVGKWQVSVGGGLQPQWRRDGKELFFITGTKLMAVEVRTGSGVFEAEAPQPLFEIQGAYAGRNRYVVTGDGQRFLVITQLADTAPAPINVVVNWMAEMKK